VTVNGTTGAFTYSSVAGFSGYTLQLHGGGWPRGSATNLIPDRREYDRPGAAHRYPHTQTFGTPKDTGFPTRSMTGAMWTLTGNEISSTCCMARGHRIFNTANLTGTVVATGSLFWKPGVPAVETFNYDWGTGSPVGRSFSVFSIRYTANNVSIEERAYEILLSAIGHAELKIDGATVATVGLGQRQRTDGDCQLQRARACHCAHGGAGIHAHQRPRQTAAGFQPAGRQGRMPLDAQQLELSLGKHRVAG